MLKQNSVKTTKAAVVSSVYANAVRRLSMTKWTAGCNLAMQCKTQSRTIRPIPMALKGTCIQGVPKNMRRTTILRLLYCQSRPNSASRCIVSPNKSTVPMICMLGVIDRLKIPRINVQIAPKSNRISDGFTIIGLVRPTSQEMPSPLPRHLEPPPRITEVGSPTSFHQLRFVDYSTPRIRPVLAPDCEP